MSAEAAARRPTAGQPFDGVKVLDLTHVLAGPFATYQLAILGAAVLKVEPPSDGDMVRPTGGSPQLMTQGLGTSYLAQNANKASVALDLSQADDREAARCLAEHADVIVENYSDGALAAFGLGYDDVRRSNPGVVYCSITGFGKGGSRASHTAYDNVIQASSGLMTVNGTDETRPVMVGAPLLDYGTGYAAAFAIAAALHQRCATGLGQRIDVAMHDVALTMMSTATVRHLNGDTFPVRNGNAGPNPGYGCHMAADGLLMIGAYTPKQSADLWRALGEHEEAEIVAGLTVAQLPQRAATQRGILERLLPRRTAEEWARLLQASGVPAAPVQTVDEAIAQAAAEGRRVFADLPADPAYGEEAIRVPLAGFALDHGGPQLHTAPSPLGTHTNIVRNRVAQDPASAYFAWEAVR